MYLDVTTGADPRAVIDPDSLRPPTAVEILTRVLGRDDAATSATSDLMAPHDPAGVLAWRLRYDESREPGPLPGLPPVPTQLAQHPDCGRYFDLRLEVLRREATLCRAETTARTAESAPA